MTEELKINKYNNTCFYKIECKDQDIKDCYIGHTLDFDKYMVSVPRLCNDDNNREFTRPVYEFIRNNGGYTNFKFSIIKYVNCSDVLDVKQKARSYIEEFKTTLNTNLPSRTRKEYCEQIGNVHHICECGGRYIYNEKSRHFKTQKHQKFLNE